MGSIWYLVIPPQHPQHHTHSMSKGYLWGQRSDKKKKRDIFASYFVQFVECVWQLWNQFPSFFEFNEEFLLFVADCVFNARFGTFLFDSEKQRVSENAKEKTISLWTFTQLNKELFSNPFAGSGGSSTKAAAVLLPNIANVTLWNSYFLRWVCHKALR